MTQHENILFVPVPEGAALTFVVKKSLYALRQNNNKDTVYEMYDLPPGNWRFIALHSQMTEEKAREVVKVLDQVVVEYYYDYECTPIIYFTAFASYHSLYRHLGLKGEQAVLKKM